MAVDYDLVVIGSSWEGIYAAATAAKLKARVALVTQNKTGSCQDSERFIRHSLTQISYLVQQRQENRFGIADDILSVPKNSLLAAKLWGEEVEENLIAEQSLTTLASLGVDVIFEQGEFCRLPNQALIVGKRKLESRAYLITTGSDWEVKSIEGKEEVNFLTINELLNQKDLAFLAKDLVVIGDSFRTLEVVQSLAKLGKNITLIIEKERLLPQEDLDVALLIQAHLEAAQVKIITNSPVTQIKKIGQKKWLQAGSYAIEADEIIWAGKRIPNIDGLNLAGVGVKYQSHRILVNNYLQTTNHQIYACGDLIGGYSLPNLAQYEANIILKNALFFPWFQVNYHPLPWAIFTEPNLARVGMTEIQARQVYGHDLYVIKQYFKSVAQAQLLGETTGFLKLIVGPQGEIIGCAIIGHQAVELINAIALMIKNKIKLNHNSICGLLQINIPYVYPSFAEILDQAANAFYQQKLARSKKSLNLLETWFNWRRR
ncbi:Mercury(II) reductase [Stanieria cyanosphaera PCC 7437]|uniref:Mercury(II) reductase n=1 Tax=Stanieria cyanosphaera (strain ATCC 29371 / PCC 7437) TaxID=111780 RepID=K9XZS1_STAC7|nr:NAD(P)/FAD-dependent oxidoreductase [Stanieria cyanosphaera]AFZ37172.1 Mercury(II) reductase [Stanieria cyanosphaera PCC 7437]